MPLHIRFELVRPRHRRETKKRRAASAHWQGRAVSGKTKKHILNVTEPVEPDEVEPFVSRAKDVLMQMGATEREADEAVARAHEFLVGHLRPVVSLPPADVRARDAARAALKRLAARAAR